MARQPADGSEIGNASVEAAVLHAEIEALRRRLAALEARLPGCTPGEPLSTGQSRWRPSTKIAVCLLAGAGLAMLAGASLVYGQGAVQSAVDALTINPNGEVSIDKLSVQKSLAAAGPVKIDGKNSLEFGAGVAGKNSEAGKIVYQAWDYALDIVGAGTTTSDRKISFWAEGGAGLLGNLNINGILSAGTVTTGTLTASDNDKGLTVSSPIKIDGKELSVTGTVDNNPTTVTWVQINGRNEFKDKENVGALRVGAAWGIPGIWSEEGDVIVGSQSGNIQLKGNVKADGTVDGNMKVVYQRDDEPQQVLQKPLWRYHMSLTYARYGGNSKTIPKEILEKLCGTPDGCEVRLGMTRWLTDSQTETASISFRFYYSPRDGHWRSSDPRNGEGVIGDGQIQHAAHVWNTCFFTDGTFKSGNGVDSGTGMQLHVSTVGDYHRNGLTCELTLIP
jgi:hypothetical protein